MKINVPGQMDIFSYMQALEPVADSFSCESDEATALVKEMLGQFNKVKDMFPTLVKQTADYETWDHVPKYGKRLSVWFWFDCNYINHTDYYCEIGVQKIFEYLEFNKLCDFAAERGLELSIDYAPTAIFFSTINKKGKRGIDNGI